MSEKDLSIDEIIKRAEEIKAQAEEHLAQAQKSLDEMAKTAIDEVTVDANAVIKKVEQLSVEEEDVKTYSTQKKAMKKIKQYELLCRNLKEQGHFQT